MSERKVLIMLEMPASWKMGGDACPMPCENCAATECPLRGAVELEKIDKWAEFMNAGQAYVAKEEK